MESLPLTKLAWRPVAVPQAHRDGVWRVLADRGGVATPIATHLSGGSGPLAGVLFAEGLDTPDTSAGATALAARGTAVIADLLQDESRGPGFRLWFVTRRATGTDPQHPDQAVLWGLARCVALEHPELGIGVVDLDEDADPAQVAALVASTIEEDQLLVRGTTVLGARLTTSASPAADPPAPPGSVLVTGTGGPSRAMAAWLEAAGADVVSVPDPTDGAAVSALVARHAPVGGVVHAASAEDDGVLLRLDAPRFATAIDPKVEGARQLRAATADQPLAYFVLVGSVSGILGSVGQANQAAADAVLDSLASQWSRPDRPTTHLALGPLAEGLPPAVRQRLVAAGLTPSTTAVAGNALGRLAAQGGSVVVADLDLDRIAGMGARFAQQPLLRELLGAPTSAAAAVLATSGSDPRGALADWLCEQAGRLLQLPVAEVARDRPLAWQGFDSLMGLDLEQALSDDLGIVAPRGLLQSGPSVDQLAEALVGALPNRAGAPAPPAPSTGLLPTMAQSAVAPSNAPVSPLPREAQVLLGALLLATLGVAWWMWS